MNTFVALANAKKELASAVVLVIGFAMPAVGQDLATWDAERARLFSQVCLKAAPGNADFIAIAKQAGFKTFGEELLYEPEVVVSLKQDGGNCNCYMTMGAPDQSALVTAVFERMLVDFPNSWKPASNNGAINDSVFLRAGAMVQVHLTPFEQGGNPWIAGSVTSAGACST